MGRWTLCVLACCGLLGQANAEDASPQSITVGRIIVRSVRKPVLKSIAETYLGTVPGPLENARVIAIPFERKTQTEADGRIEIELTGTQPLYIAVSWANDKPGEWSKEAMGKSDFIHAGWTLVGDMPARSSSGKVEYRGLYWRAGKRGEKFSLRTRKSIAPLVISPRPGAPKPTAGGVDVAGDSLPPRVAPSPAVELTCVRPLLPVAADKFCTFKGTPCLEGAIIYACPYRPKERDPEAGRLSIQVKQDTALFVAASWEDADTSQPWGREVVSQDAMRKAGWILVGGLAFTDPAAPQPWVFWRQCRAGEQIVLRTRKAYPPLVLVPRDAKADPIASMPSDEMSPGIYRAVLASKVEYFLEHRRWSELEKMIAEFRRTKQRLANGTELLRAFYEGCKPRLNDEQNTAKQKLLEDWLADQPQSMAAHVALAHFFEIRAWQARGGDYAYKVTAEGGRSFAQYVAQAESLVEKAGKLAEKDPYLYDVQAQLAIDAGWPREKLKQLLLDCAALDPQHTTPFVGAARYFQTRWHGAPGDLERYALWATERTRAQKGDLIYFYIVREMRHTHGSSVLNAYDFDWQRIKQGALDDIRMHPTVNTTHGQLAEYAFFQGDRPTAREELEKFEQFPESTAHWKGTSLDLIRRWVRDDYLQGDQEAVFEVTRSPILAIDWSNDTTQWLVFDNNGDIQYVDSNSGKRTASNRACGVQPRIMALVEDVAVVASWDQKVHAVYVKTGVDKQFGEHKNLTDAMLSGDGRYWVTASPDGILRFWDLDRDTKPEDCDTKPSLVQSLASLPGEQGFVTGDRDGKLELWSLYGRKRVREIGKLRSGTKVVRISRDGTLLAAVSRGWLTLWRMPEGKKIAEVPSPALNMLEFSPDGKWLAGATGNMQPVADASVWLWDTSDGTKAKEFRGHKAIVRALAFDVESRSLVSGGDDMTLRVWKIPR